MSTAWWDVDELDGHESFELAWAALENLRSAQAWRVSEGLAAERMYEQRQASGQRTSGAALGGLFQDGTGGSNLLGLLTYNLMQVNFDTLTSKILQSLPQVNCMTDNGNFDTRQKAEVMERMIRAGFVAVGHDEKCEERIVNMLLYGFGATRWYVDPVRKRPKMKVRHSLDIWFDEMEARDAPPRTMYDALIVSKSALAKKHPKHADAIRRATIGQVFDRDLYPVSGDADDLCEVVEAWHLGDDGEPGRWIKFVNTCELDCDEFKERHFPYTFQFWTKRRRGPYPVSAASQVMLLQLTHNKLLRRWHECIHKLAAPRILYDSSSGLSPSQFRTSGVGDLIAMDMTGRPAPVVMNPSVVPQDILVALQAIEQEIATILGVTGMESSGAPPQGVDSQPAMMEYSNQTSLRHFKTLKEGERAVMQDAKQLLATMRECENYELLTEAMGEMEKVKFADYDLPPDEYKIQLAPANALSMIPSQRLQQVMMMSQSGVLSPTRALRAMHSPDIMAITSDLTAREKEIEWSIWLMSKPGAEYVPPRPTSDLSLGIQMFSDAYSRMRRQNAPQDALARIDRWIAEATSKQQQFIQMQQALAQMQQAQMQAQEMQQQQQEQQAEQQQQQPTTGQNNGVA